MTLKVKFTIKSFYRVLCEGSSDIDFPVDAIWKSKAPTKALFFWLRQLQRGKCLLKICLREEISIWLVDALCVLRGRNG